MGLKIGFDMTDAESRKFYFDDSRVLTSNPPQYKVWYLDDTSDQEFVLANNVFVLKRVPESELEEVCIRLGISYTPPVTSSTTIIENKVEYKEEKQDTFTSDSNRPKPIMEIKVLPQEKTEIINEDVVEEAPKKKRGRPKKTLIGKNGFPHVGGKGSHCPSVKKEDTVELPNGGSMICIDPGKFEYMVVDEVMDITDEFSNTLNEYGGDGWEMCGFNVYREGLLSSELRVMCIFKRRV